MDDPGARYLYVMLICIVLICFVLVVTIVLDRRRERTTNFGADRLSGVVRRPRSDA
jgi:hypothetical protein